MPRRPLLHEVSHEDRVKYTECTSLTLDGAPARVSGYLQDVATVRRKDGKGGGVEYAWATVKYVIENKEGRFRS